MKHEQIYHIKNIGIHERDILHGREVFENCEKIQYLFLKYWDGMISDIKREYTEKRQYVLIHDINLYKHGKDSAHPDGDAIDYSWINFRPYLAIMFALKWKFSGIFFYPYRKRLFFHNDWKIRNRPHGITTLGFEDKKGEIITTNRDIKKVMEELERLRKRRS